jgi:hypothetical protein
MVPESGKSSKHSHLLYILSMSHIAEQGYSAYASLQVAITLVSADLEYLIAQVKELVGEVDFKFE